MKQSKMYRLSKALRKYWPLYVMMAGGVLYFVIFKYATLSGLLIAFKNFNMKKGILASEWVGLENFKKVFRNTDLPGIFGNTLIISFWKLVLGFPAPVILALLLNEVSRPLFKRIIQSTIYLPRFISWIIMAGICSNLFSTTTGMIPLFLAKFGITMPSFLGDTEYFRGFLYATDVWKNMGWGTIIYMAALSGIDPQLYEAASIDGCSRWKAVFHVTLPCISTTMVTMLVLNFGSVMNAGFDQIFALYSDATRSVSDIIDTYVYRLGMTNYKYEFATAIGMAKSVINAIMLFAANWAAGKISEESPL